MFEFDGEGPGFGNDGTGILSVDAKAAAAKTMPYIREVLGNTQPASVLGAGPVRVEGSVSATGWPLDRVLSATCG